MENKTIFIEKAYKEAMLYADNTINKSMKSNFKIGLLQTRSDL